MFFLWLYSCGALGLYFSAVFALCWVKQRNDWVDMAWGPGFVLVATLGAVLQGATASVKAWLVLAMVTLWAVRLSGHIFLRSRGKSEDFRYVAMREAWGKWAPLKAFFKIFMLQGFVLAIISLPIVAVWTNHKALSGLSYLGLALWIFGFMWETVGDYQLLRFTKNPENKGKLMTRGLWRLSRHPNYFGEVTLWWGLWLFVLPSHWITLLGPSLLSFFILKISGIPMLEKKYEGRADFEAYKQSTPAFFPKVRG